MKPKETKIKSRDLKIEKVQEITDKIAKTKTLVFADYSGLKVNQIAAIRQKVKDAGGELIVAKNTLILRALNNNKMSTTLSQLAGPTAALFAYEDEISPIKIIAESNKIIGTPKFKFGFLDKNFLNQEAIEELAKIPLKETLQATLVSSLSSPIYGVVSVLQANIRNLVSVLDQAANKLASS